MSLKRPGVRYNDLRGSPTSHPCMPGAREEPSDQDTGRRAAQLSLALTGTAQVYVDQDPSHHFFLN